MEEPKDQVSDKQSRKEETAETKKQQSFRQLINMETPGLDEDNQSYPKTISSVSAP